MLIVIRQSDGVGIIVGKYNAVRKTQYANENGHMIKKSLNETVIITEFDQLLGTYSTFERAALILKEMQKAESKNKTYVMPKD